MTTKNVKSEEFPALPWVVTLRKGLAESDARIRAAGLNDGWKVVRHRGAVIREAMKRFCQHVVQQIPPEGAFAIHTLGGTGRQEICPDSDVDLGVIVDNVEENEDFVKNLLHQLRLFAPFVPGLRRSIKLNAFPDLNDIEHFDLKSLAALLDGDLLVGEIAFDRRIRSLCQQRAAQLGLEFVFAVHEDMRQYDLRYPQLPGDVGGFHVKNGIGGLRNFHLTMWLYSFERWIPSMDVYQQARSTRRFDTEGAPTPETIDAVGVLFTVRCWLEQRRNDESDTNDQQSLTSSLLIDVHDLDAFRSRFGAEGLTQLNTSRQIIRSYRHESWDRLREQGVSVPNTEGLVIWGQNGLRIGVDALFRDATEVFFSLYEAQQRLGIPIEQSVKRAARKNISKSLRDDSALIDMMVSSGSVLPALEDWFDFGILGHLVPGFDELANQLYEPDHRTAMLTRSARALQRVENLEQLATPTDPGEYSLETFFWEQYRDLGASARGALRLALLTEEIPETLYKNADSYADAVNLYITDCLRHVPSLSGPTLRTIEFLLLTKRELIESSEMSDQQQVLEHWQHQIEQLESRDEADTVRALALFAYSAFDFRKHDGAPRDRLDFEQWQNVKNLTQNLLHDALGIRGQFFDEDYFDALGQRIGSLLPRRLLASPHIDNTLRRDYEGTEFLDPHRTHRIIHAIKDVVESGRPNVDIARSDEYFRLTLFAWDSPGLFWRVAGTLFELGCSIRNTDLYGIPDPAGQATNGDTLIRGEAKLICDVLTFNPPADAGESWQDETKRRIVHRIENPTDPMDDNTFQILEPVMESLRPRLTNLGNGLVKFSCHSPYENRGTRYAISRLLSERAGASIESIARDGTRDWRIPRTNFYIRVPSDIQSVATAMQDVLGDIAILA